MYIKVYIDSAKKVFNRIINSFGVVGIFKFESTPISRFAVINKKI